MEELSQPQQIKSTTNGTPPRPNHLPQLQTNLQVPASPPRTRVFLSKDQALAKPPLPTRILSQRAISTERIVTKFYY